MQVPFGEYTNRGCDFAFDDAVGDGNIGTAAYIGNHACRGASIAGIAALDVHIADAARDGGFAIRFSNQS